MHRILAPFRDLAALAGIACWGMLAIARTWVPGGDGMLRAPGWVWWVLLAAGAVLFLGVVAVERMPSPLWAVVFGVLTVATALLPWLEPVYGLTLVPMCPVVVTLTYAYGWRLAALVAALDIALLLPLDPAFLFYGLLFATFILNTHQQGTLARQRDQLLAAHEELRAAHAGLTAAQGALARATRDEERLRIARDLHDAIGHQLTGLALQLEVAAHVATGEAGEPVARARAVAKELLEEVRGVVDRLRARHADLADELTDMACAVPRPRVHLSLRGDLAACDDERAEVILRCVQEGLTNAVRHAGAANLWAEVAREDDGAVCIGLRDDGAGAADVVPGNGLTGMRERVTGQGGTLEWDGTAGFGIVIRLPGGAR